MDSRTHTGIENLAAECVGNMGDIFWDYEPERDRARGYTEPATVAKAAVADALRILASELDTRPVYTTILQHEYESLLAHGVDREDDRAIEAVLVAHAEWTPTGAAKILELAREHGVFGLRNALALAAALGIEDGSSGM